MWYRLRKRENKKTREKEKVFLHAPVVTRYRNLNSFLQTCSEYFNNSLFSCKVNKFRLCDV